uniref:BZIP domain-containing protein n=1 Tax=Panagrolaimus davidi TaxID=227884 RepID=A0A914QXL1_9BILA
MSSGYCNGYSNNDQYRCGPDIYYNTTYWNQEYTVATAAVTPLTPQSVMLSNCQNGEFLQPMMAATNAQSSYSNIRQNLMINQQTSKSVEYSGGIKLLDISSKPNHVSLDEIQISAKDGAFNISSDDFGTYLEGVNVTDTFSSNSSASRTDMEEDEESEEESLTDSDSPKRTETRGRKRIFNKKQRKERRKKTVIQSYHRCAERNAAYRQFLTEEVKKLERENNELLQKFGRLINQSENLANFMPEDDENYARNYIQTVKTNVENIKINCK